MVAFPIGMLVIRTHSLTQSNVPRECGNVNISRPGIRPTFTNYIQKQVIGLIPGKLKDTNTDHFGPLPFRSRMIAVSVPPDHQINYKC